MLIMAKDHDGVALSTELPRPMGHFSVKTEGYAFLDVANAHVWHHHFSSGELAQGHDVGETEIVGVGVLPGYSVEMDLQ